MNENGLVFANTFKIVPGQTSPEDALSAGNYPASAAFIDTRGYSRVHVLIHLGAIHASDVPVFTLQEASAANGTPQNIDTTYAKHTSAADDDDEFVVFTLDTSQLTDGYPFITCLVAGVSNGSYGDILYFLQPAGSFPVTQTTTDLPEASQYVLA